MVSKRLGRATAVVGLWLACRADEDPDEWAGYTMVKESQTQQPIPIERNAGQGPFGTRSVTAEAWSMETVGKHVMVAFLSPEDKPYAEFPPAWKIVAEQHEQAAYTGLYEVDCEESPRLCEKSKKFFAPHIMYGTPSTNLSELVVARTKLGPDALAEIAGKLGPVCSLAHTAGCSKKDKKRIKELKKKTREQLETEMQPLREKLEDFFERRHTWEEGADVLWKEIRAWQQKMKAVKLERAELMKADRPEAEQQKKDAELDAQLDAIKKEKQSRKQRLHTDRNERQPAFDAEWELLDKEVKSSDYSLLRMVLDSKSKKKMSEEL